MDYSLSIVPGISPAERHKLEDKLDVFLGDYEGESTGGGTMLDGSGSDLEFYTEQGGFEGPLKAFLKQKADLNATVTLVNLDQSQEIFSVECSRGKRWWEFWK